MDKDSVLNTAISNVQVRNNIDFRKIYEDSVHFVYGNELPIEIDEKKINKYMVNEIRHNYTNYENTLRKVNRINDTYSNAHYMLYKNNVLKSISNKYPTLKDECERQKHTMVMIKKI